MTSDKINELNEAENPARDLLARLGYSYVPREEVAAERDHERAVLLDGRLRRALFRLNPWLTEDQASRVIFNLRNLDAVGIARNQLVHEYLTYGMPIREGEAGSDRTRVVRFFDFDHPDPKVGKNEYVVTTQMRIRRGNERSTAYDDDDERVVKPDLVLFVNGIPLVVIEAKSATLIGDVWKARAVRQLRRYQEAAPEWNGKGAPELFDYNLMCVAICGADAAFGTVGAGEGSYVAWKSVAPFSEQEVRDRFGVEPKGQAQLIAGLLAPQALLDILRDYVVFEPEGGKLVKKLPRYQQYRAVTAAVDRMLTGKRPEERGGVVWHTQGSGKSLTMLWFATKLRREGRLDNPTIVIVTDRTQLDTQISATFKRCGFPSPERASSTQSLRTLLTSGSGRTIMTTVQKFDDALTVPEGTLEVLNPADNVVVIVDEAHRTQYGLLGAKMSKALPRATFVGFTGTPIDKGFRRSTMRRFGPLIDQYTIPQSVADGATVPILYEARLPELSVEGPQAIDRLFDALFGNEPREVRARIRRRYASAEKLAEADQRIEQVALDIATHFAGRIRPNGFKAQVVAPSRLAAVRYAEKLNSFKQFGIVAYPIITTSPDDDSVYDEARKLAPHHETLIEQFKDQHGEPQVLVVVDMLLTGFDAPIEQLLYLDREMKEHGLLQAIARVNRPCTLVNADGVVSEKGYGLVIDYWGVSHHLEQALASFDAGDIQEAMKPLEEDPAPVIDAVANRAESWFKGKNLADPWACVRVVAADEHTDGGYKADLYEKFAVDYRDFARLMDRFLPDPRALAYAGRFARLTQIRAYVRAHFMGEDSSVDWADVSSKVRKLIDDRIGANVRELMKPVSILDRDFDQKIAGLPHDEARASLMEHAIRAQIKERIAENPAFYEKLSEQLERIIEQMRRRLIDAAEACRQMAALRRSVTGLGDTAAQAGLSEVSLAVYELLERAEGRGARPATRDLAGFLREQPGEYHAEFDESQKAIARNIEDVMRNGQSVVDWQNNSEVVRIMRRDIKRELRAIGTLSEDNLNELAASMVEIARRKMVR